VNARVKNVHIVDIRSNNVVRICAAAVASMASAFTAAPTI
jgi:hypothetical protein